MRDMLIPGKKLTQMRTIFSASIGNGYLTYLLSCHEDICHLKLTKSTFDSQVTNFQNLLYPHICEEKIECLVMMSMKPSPKIVKFMTPESGVQGLGI